MVKKFVSWINNLRPQQLMMLAGACGVLIFGLVYLTLSQMAKQEAEQVETKKPAVEMVKVVVAKQNIPVRTRIQESMLQMKEMPVTAVPEGAFKDFSMIINEPARVSIFAGDILTQQKLFGEHNDEGFLGTIPPNCRAVSISVNNVTGVAGFAKPGDFVDLVIVEKDNYSATTKLLLQNVLLLSINQSMTGSSDVGEVINNPSIATLALRPEEALKLISSAKLGEIYLMLRPFKPNNMYVGALEYTIESVNKPKPEEPKPQPAPTPPQPTPQPIPQPIPQIPSNTKPAPTLPLTPPEPKIEIIIGDEVKQSSNDGVQIITPQSSNLLGANAGDSRQSVTDLPIIPSRPIIEPPPKPSGGN